MPISVQNLGASALELGVHGLLDKDDYTRVVPLIEGIIGKHGNIALLVHISKLHGWTPAGLWEDLKFDVKHYRDVSRVAVVAPDEGKQWMATLSKPFTAARVEFFTEAQVESARDWVRGSKSPVAQGDTSFRLESSAFGPGDDIPPRHAREDEDSSPPLSWSGAPEDTKTYALIVDDPDAPSGTFTHWVAFNIPVSDQGLPEGVQHRGDMTDGMLQGRNDYGDTGYGGPRPPAGTRHRYVFKLYALDERLNLEPGATKAEVEQAMQGHLLSSTQLVGSYARPITSEVNAPGPR